MRRFVLRAVLIAALPFALMSAPDAEAKPPGSCDLLNNTHCHCVGPGLMECLIIP